MSSRIPDKASTFKHCAYVRCTAEVDEKDRCPGCNRFICDEHYKRDVDTVGHPVEAHWEEEKP